jgi:hypothetical protein
MSSVSVEKRSVSRTGSVCIGWRLGRGFVREKLTVESEVWCVVDGSKVLAECRSKAGAERIAKALKETS